LAVAVAVQAVAVVVLAYTTQAVVVVEEAV
jgi:hypothetical protein